MSDVTSHSLRFNLDIKSDDETALLISEKVKTAITDIFEEFGFGVTREERGGDWHIWMDLKK